MTTSRRLTAVLLGLVVTAGTATTAPAPGAPAAPPAPADRSRPWPAASTLDTEVDIEAPQVLRRYASSDSGEANRAIWIAGRPGASAVRVAEGPPLKHGTMRNLSPGPTQVTQLDAGTGLVTWWDAGRAVLEVVGIGTSGGQGTSYGVISAPQQVPDTQSMGRPVELTVPDGPGERSAVVWLHRQPDGKYRIWTRLVAFEAFSQTFTFGPVQDVAGPSDSIDEVRAYWAGSRLLVAYRTTAADGTQSLRLRTGSVADVAQGVAWEDDQQLCAAGCADPTFAYSGVTQVLYREAGTLTSRTLGTGPGGPTALGPAPSSYAVHDQVVEYLPSGRARTTPMAVATADSSGVRLWRADRTGAFTTAQQLSTVPATGVALGARHGNDLVLWRQGTSVITVRGRGDRWTDPAVVSGADTVVDAGFSEAGSLPVIWYVDTGTGVERLRTSSIDDEGPVTLWGGIHRGRHHPQRLRLEFQTEDPSGIRITTVQVRFGPPGDLGPWGVFERLTHRGQRHIDRTLRLEGRVGIRYCARARAVDVVGNVGAWGQKSGDDGAYFLKRCITVRS
jgi:hypothetical protein